MAHVDQLLEEYLRVINTKDDEIHGLIRGLEEHRCELKKREDTYKADVLNTQQKLQRAHKQIKKMDERHEKDETDINRLVNHNESMKGQLQLMQQKLDEATKMMEDHRQEHARVLEQVRRQHIVEVQSLRNECDELKREQKNVWNERETARKAVEACDSREKQLLAKEVADVELRKSLEDMRLQMQSMIPKQVHTDAIAQCEESIRALKQKATEEANSLKADLSRIKKSAGKYRTQLDELRILHEQLEKKYTEVSHEGEEARQRLDVEREASKKLLASKEKEIEVAHELTEKVTAKLDAAMEQVRLNQVKVQATEYQLREKTEILEQERRRSKQECEKLSLQLNNVQSDVAEQQREAERLQRRLEEGVAELKESHVSLASVKEASLRESAELREKIALLTAERDRVKEDRDRIVFELKDAQHQLSMLRERLAEDKKTLCAKIDAANVNIERMKDQLKDKEHHQETMLAVQEKRLQEVAWAHKNEVNECKRALESEVNDLRQRLESTTARLTEEVSNNKLKQRELQTSEEALRNIRQECERCVAEARENLRLLEETRRETLTLRETVTKQKQLLDTASEIEARLRRSVSQLESERAEDTRRSESLMRTLTEAKEELASKQKETLELKHELKKAIDENSKKELANLKKKLCESQESVEQLRQEGVEMRRERDRQLSSFEKLQEQKEMTERELRECNEKLQRVSAELQLKAEESTQIARHAKEVEDLAKRSCEELERELSRRDAVIESLQHELPRLGDERAKVAVLEERLSHKTDLNRLEADGLRDRITLLEKDLEAREEQLRRQLSEMEVLGDRNRSLQDRVEEMEELLTQKEKKHAMRKEALRKALEQVDAAAERKTEAEKNLTRMKKLCEQDVEVYKAKVEELQEELQKTRKAHETAEAHLSLREQELGEVKRLSGISQGMLEEQLERVKQQQSAQFIKKREELHEAINRLDMLNRQLEETREALSVSEEAKKEALEYAGNAQRRVSNFYCRLVTNFAEDAMLTKEMFGDFAITIASRAFHQLGRVTHNGWEIAASYKQNCSEQLQQQQIKMRREMDELKRIHKEEMQAVVDDRNKELSKIALQHGADIAQLRQEIVDATARASRDTDAALKDYRRKEEQFHRDKTELECAKLEIAHHEDQISALKEQLRSFEQRAGAARSHNETELRTALRAKETLQVQLEETRRQVQLLQQQLNAARQGAQQTGHTAAAQQSRLEERVAELTKTVNGLEVEKRRLERQARNDEKKIAVLEKELAEVRKREAELSSQLQARKAENSALKERCANLESLKNISEVTLAETRLREKDLLEKMEEMRSAQQLMQLCFDKQQEQLEVGRRMHEQDVNRSGFYYKDGR
ncbi:hypothetical protein LSM04_002163 [Trypanosoma melophagium]|uniref:uncharacterized protein n=1 Tax=Trypanosoma melophagium TaxID=715481 RepID=UPI003519FCAD|nr:hypothetical protein LSM04_002163 [Trypanosoma melophagium]